MDLKKIFLALIGIIFPREGCASGRRLFLTFLQVLGQSRNFALLPRIPLSAGEKSYTEGELVIVM